MIIGISGKIGSGKTTVAELILAKDKRFESKSFVFKLKKIVALLTGSSYEDNITQEGKNKGSIFGKTLGELQQIIGTNVMRDNFDKDVWVKALFADYNPDKSFWIISDVRFKNEADYIKQMGGIIVRIEGDPAGVRANSKRDHTHPSETELDNYDFDCMYYNEEGVTELQDYVNNNLLPFASQHCK